MSKTVFVLELPEPKIRKKHAPPGKTHKDASKYSRKCKHKARREEAPGSYREPLLLTRLSRKEAGEAGTDKNSGANTAYRLRDRLEVIS